MSRTNVEPMATFGDGSELIVSTTRAGDEGFRCELYVSRDYEERLECRVAPACVEARTCLEAQERAYLYAMHLYPTVGSDMKKPPYLIWGGPFVQAGGDKP
jgi:hypothetical protein